MSKKYNLVGVINSSESPYGLVRPVFQDKKGNRFFGIADSNLEYKKFELVKAKAPFRDVNSFKNVFMEIDGVMKYETKSKAIYGFMFDHNNLYLGSIENMYEFLITHDFSDNLQVQKETKKCKEELEGYQKLKQRENYM